MNDIRNSLIDVKRCDRDDPDAILLIPLLERWEAAKQDGVLPSRRPFSPETVKPFVGDIHLLDVIDDGKGFLMSIYGSAIAQANSQDYSGMRISEIPHPSARMEVLKQYQEIVRTLKPSIYTIRLETAGRKVDYTRLTVPLSNDHDGRTQLMSFIVHPEDLRSDYSALYKNVITAP